MRWSIELRVYTEKSNPTWIESDHEIVLDELNEILKRLPKIDNRCFTTSKGYMGIVVSVRCDECRTWFNPNHWFNLDFYKGMVGVYCHGEVIYLMDKDRELEKLIMSTAPPDVVSNDLKNRVLNEIEGSY